MYLFSAGCYTAGVSCKWLHWYTLVNHSMHYTQAWLHCTIHAYTHMQYTCMFTMLNACMVIQRRHLLTHLPGEQKIKIFPFLLTGGRSGGMEWAYLQIPYHCARCNTSPGIWRLPFGPNEARDQVWGAEGPYGALGGSPNCSPSLVPLSAKLLERRRQSQMVVYK